jgi:hypothetical protein
MLELLLCATFTILPDYLYRRYGQGKRFGHEITLFSVWYELRWGITLCIILTLLMITTIFYYHPSTRNAASFYRSVAILPEASGRVAEIYVSGNADVKEGDPIFRLDSTEQESRAELAERRLAEIDAEIVMAQADIAAALGQVRQAQGALRADQDELALKTALKLANPAGHGRCGRGDAASRRNPRDHSVARATRIGGNPIAAGADRAGKNGGSRRGRGPDRAVCVAGW